MKKLGFGFMRLPVLEDGKVDLAQVSAMVDRFLAEIAPLIAGVSNSQAQIDL